MMPMLKTTKPFVTPARLKVIEAARERLKDYEELFPDRLKRWGGVDRVEDLTASGYNRLIDFLTLAGFRHRRHPILSRQARDLIHHAYCDLGLSHHAFETDLRRAGRVGDVLDLNGDGLLSLMEVMEHRGVNLDAFKAARRSLTPQQLRLLGMARKAVEIPDASYYAFLQTYGGVNTASDLDRRGFDFMMLYLEYNGFVPTRMEVGDPSLANRLGFATPKQARLVETLWAEWSGKTDAAALNAWLYRSFTVSSVRFLTTGTASKAITALKNMKRRAA